MSLIRVTIVDPLGDASWDAELPADAPMNQLVPQLLPKLGISHGSFQLQLKRTERILGPNDTLRNAEVQAGDALRIVAVGPGIQDSYMLAAYIRSLLSLGHDLEIKFSDNSWIEPASMKWFLNLGIEFSDWQLLSMRRYNWHIVTATVTVRSQPFDITIDVRPSRNYR